MVSLPLFKFACARSGDKGNHATIALLARESSYYDFLCEKVTIDRVASYFAALGPTRVRRYELPYLDALHFVLENVLEGGGSLSLRLDSQGKALGQALLLMEIEVELKLTM